MQRKNEHERENEERSDSAERSLWQGKGWELEGWPGKAAANVFFRDLFLHKNFFNDFCCFHFGLHGQDGFICGSFFFWEVKVGKDVFWHFMWHKCFARQSRCGFLFSEGSHGKRLFDAWEFDRLRGGAKREAHAAPAVGGQHFFGELLSDVVLGESEIVLCGFCRRGG